MIINGIQKNDWLTMQNGPTCVVANPIGGGCTDPIGPIGPVFPGGDGDPIEARVSAAEIAGHVVAALLLGAQTCL